MKTVLFYQHFGMKNVVRGAHHKTYDFYHHILDFDGYKPVIYFDETSLWEPNIPWFHLFDRMPTLKDLSTEPDILFLNSGKDWIKYTNHRNIADNTPIVSPVNNFRAVNPEHPAFQFLNTKAIRLCPSYELYEAVEQHPNTNGQTIYLPNGVGITDEAQSLKHNKKFDVLIVGNKNPELARAIFQSINKSDLSIEVIDGWISKEDFQNKLALSRISVHCPKVVEEHYIPGVEALMLDSLLIIPDCVGNRSYSIDKKTCLLTSYDLEGMVTTLNKMLSMSKAEQQTMLDNAREASHVFQIQHEKDQLLKVLNSCSDFWA
jgi:hypothetical protein